MTSKEKKQQKEAKYSDDKYNFMHSLSSLYTILEINYAVRNDEFVIDRGDYRYDIEVDRDVYAYADNPYDMVSISRMFMDINETKQKGLVIETCILIKYKKHEDRILQFPLMLEKKVDIPLYDFGKYYMPSYNKVTQKPTYCYFCDSCYKNLRSHFKNKKHETNKMKCVNDELKDILNKDCIMNICEYL